MDRGYADFGEFGFSEVRAGLGVLASCLWWKS
jgi:hypothetical protein